MGSFKSQAGMQVAARLERVHKSTQNCNRGTMQARCARGAARVRESMHESGNICKRHDNVREGG